MKSRAALTYSEKKGEQNWVPILCESCLGVLTAELTKRAIDNELLHPFNAARKTANSQLTATRHADGDAVQDILVASNYSSNQDRYEFRHVLIIGMTS